MFDSLGEFFVRLQYTSGGLIALICSSLFVIAVAIAVLFPLYQTPGVSKGVKITGTLAALIVIALAVFFLSSFQMASQWLVDKAKPYQKYVAMCQGQPNFSEVDPSLYQKKLVVIDREKAAFSPLHFLIDPTMRAGSPDEVGLVVCLSPQEKEVHSCAYDVYKNGVKTGNTASTASYQSSTTIIVINPATKKAIQMTTIDGPAPSENCDQQDHHGPGLQPNQLEQFLKSQ